jgi:nicotinamide riboside transporter PnuC
MNTRVAWLALIAAVLGILSSIPWSQSGTPHPHIGLIIDSTALIAICIFTNEL